jgi:hypothetical protein
MERCDNCGNAYDKNFKVIKGDEIYTFDCFECAINKLAPVCKCCGTRIIGHGLENGSDLFCCAGCARMDGVTELADHVPQVPGSH